MDDGNKLNSTFYGGLLDRFHNLEASHEKLKEQFDILLQETKSINVDVRDVTGSHDDAKNDSLEVPGEMRADPNWAYVPGTFFSGSPYKNLLECMGHAVHICRASSGEFIFWNRSAEQLFGYKDYEVLGCTDEGLLVDERNRGLSERIMDRLSCGLSWSGQFPFKKKSGQMFMAIVTKSQLYEDGELVGTITISSDAAVFNNLCPESLRVGQDDGKHRARGINLKKIQWRAQPPNVSAFSNLAPKILLRKDGDNGQDGFSNIGEKEQNDQLDEAKSERPPRAPAARSRFNCKFPIGKNIFNAGEGSENEVPTSESSPPLKFAEKILAKLHIGDIGIATKDKEQNGFHNASFGKEALVESSSPVEKQASTSYNSTDAKYRAVPFPSNNKCSQAVRDSKQLMSDSPNSGENTSCSPLSSSSKGDHNESNMIVVCEIYWEDLELHEEIGQGSFAVVYRGIWNGSDVAVKVYLGNEYNDDTLLGYTKELDIMRRLRHPNVLLFMGAVSSKEKLGLVTELLPRGSLFKVLHRNNQKLDIKRRLRMALDVARGMNYLHRRNPPIVHRDLKSSNLLVDKSWTVKVGDFGLSKLKDATFLTAKSGRGTPQWMAPEVLRNEPSTEKSDVFSFGVILWELMTESIPWHSLNFLQVVGVVGFMDRRLDIPENLDPKVSSLIQDCWQSKQDNRPSFEDIIQTMADLIQTGIRREC